MLVASSPVVGFGIEDDEACGNGEGDRLGSITFGVFQKTLSVDDCSLCRFASYVEESSGLII